MAVHVGGKGPGHLARTQGLGGIDRSAYMDLRFGWPRSAYWLDGGLYDTFGSVPGAASTGGAGFGQAVRNGAWSGGLPDGTPLIGDGGLGVWEARTNLFLNSATPATQSITLGATGTYTITCFDAGSVAVAAGTATITGAGTATPGSPLVINCTATGTITCTVSGSPYCVNVTAGANINGPPIFTTGLAATRTAVAQSVGGLVLPPAFEARGQFRLGALPSAGMFPRVFSFTSPDGLNEMAVFVASTGRVGLFCRLAGVTQADLGSRTVLANQDVTFQAVFKTDAFSMAVNNQAPELDGSGSLPGGPLPLTLGYHISPGTRVLNGEIANLSIREAA